MESSLDEDSRIIMNEMFKWEVSSVKCNGESIK